MAWARWVLPTPAWPQIRTLRRWRTKAQVARSKTCWRLMPGLKPKSNSSRVLVVSTAPRRIQLEPFVLAALGLVLDQARQELDVRPPLGDRLLGADLERVEDAERRRRRRWGAN